MPETAPEFDDADRFLPVATTARERIVREGFADKMLRVAGRVPFAQDLAAAYYCAVDMRTPRRVKAVLFGALAYFVVPTDLIPDIFAAIGFSDDAAVLMTALAAVGGSIREEHRRRARRLFGIAEIDLEVESEHTPR